MKEKVREYGSSVFTRECKRERTGYAKMLKEDRLKSVCRRFIYVAFEMGKCVGRNLVKKKDKRIAEGLQYLFWKRISGEMTRGLKKARVLPLKKAA